MFSVVPFKVEHVMPLLSQSININLKNHFFNHGKKFEKTGNAFTGMWHGEAMVCGAIEPIWENRGIIWCVFNEESKRNFIPVFRALKKILKESKFRRIELSIPPGSPKDTKRAELLGFTLECPLARKYLPDGEDCAIYSLIKEERNVQ